MSTQKRIEYQRLYREQHREKANDTAKQYYRDNLPTIKSKLAEEAYKRKRFRALIKLQKKHVALLMQSADIRARIEEIMREHSDD